jgi:hypothetical protein
MKQTNPSSALWMIVSIGTLGLNEDFVQLNELMTLFLYKYPNFNILQCQFQRIIQS